MEKKEIFKCIKETVEEKYDNLTCVYDEDVDVLIIKKSNRICTLKIEEDEEYFGTEKLFIVLIDKNEEKIKILEYELEEFLNLDSLQLEKFCCDMLSVINYHIVKSEEN